MSEINRAVKSKTFKTRTEPLFLKFRSSNGFILTTICLAAFTDGFLYAIVVPVLPYSLSKDAGLSEDEVQRWSSYLLTAVGLTTLLTSPIAGLIADHTSFRRAPFLFGLALQAISTALFLLPPRAPVLLLARCLFGVSTAIVFAVGLALLVDTVGMEDIGRNAGYFLSSANLGVLISPLVGGIVYAWVGYFAVVGMMLGLVGLDVLLRVVMVEKGVAAAARRKTPAGALVSARFRVEAEQRRGYGTIDGPSTEFRKPGATSSGGLFVRLVRTPRAMASVFAVLASYTILAALDARLALFLKENFGFTSSAAGASFLAIALPSLLAPVAGALSDRLGTRCVAVGGFGAAGVALIGAGLVEGRGTKEEVGVLFVMLVVIGVGVAAVLPCVATDLTEMATELSADSASSRGSDESTRGAYAQSFSMFNCGMGAGTMLGPLWMSFPAVGWQMGMFGLSVSAFVACGPILIYFGKKGVKSRQGLS